MTMVERVLWRAQAELRNRREPVLRHVVPALQRSRLLVPTFRLYGERLAGGLEVLLHRPGGAPGLGDQDIWIVAASAAPASG